MGNLERGNRDPPKPAPRLVRVTPPVRRLISPRRAERAAAVSTAGAAAVTNCNLSHAGPEHGQRSGFHGRVLRLSPAMRRQRRRCGAPADARQEFRSIVGNQRAASAARAEHDCQRYGRAALRRRAAAMRHRRARCRQAAVLPSVAGARRACCDAGAALSRTSRHLVSRAAFLGAGDERTLYTYLLRVLGFVLILYAIIDKNVSSSRGPR